VRDIYRSIGVEPLIDCRGAIQNMLGSLRRPSVQRAMEAASHNFVQYDELADGIGSRLAELTGAEWGMVSSGCAAGMKHLTAACISGGNPEKLIRIPDLKGLDKYEVIIPLYARNVYDHGIRNIGVTIVHVNTAEDLKNAISSRTAMIYLTSVKSSDTGQPLSLEVIAGIAKPHNIPILVDCAPDNLTIPPVHLQRGASVVAYSGGKAMGGPHCAGLLLGDKDLLMSAWQASSPHHGPGRDNKVGREEMMGMLAAVEDWIQRDHDEDWKRWLSWLNTISSKLSGIEGIKTNVVEPSGLGNKSPVLYISWDPSKIHINGSELAELVARTKPRMAIGNRDSNDGMTSVYIATSQMQEGEDKIVANRLHELLSEKRSPHAPMKPPAVKLETEWDVEVQYFTSTGRHKFLIHQDGNWLSGTHRTEFNSNILNGTIEGNQIKLNCPVRVIGDQLTYMFSGILIENAIRGDVYLGEYLTAKFIARPYKNNVPRRRVNIPAGPPLAT
jgi:D-glucosaminate-6-phosphate ammonia-lyase